MTNLGTTLFQHDGYTYWKTNYVNQNNRVRWYCSSRKGKGCPVVLTCCDTRIVSKLGAHNHDMPMMHVDNYGKYYKMRKPRGFNSMWRSYRSCFIHCCFISHNHKYLQLLGGEDLVQCVPTRKGHQILYKGYTYVFKSRLQCGAEQWCCSYRQKTGCISVINMQVCGVEVVRDFHNHKKPMFSDDAVIQEEFPEWVSIYFMKKDANAQRCNICEAVVQTTEKSLELLGHLKTSHSEVIELHKNPDSSVGFRIEFLQLNVLNEDGAEKTQPVILGEVCEGPTEEVVSEKTIALAENDPSNVQYLLIPRKRKYKRDHETRKRSWVWKYFDKLSTIIFRCNICNVVLSIKGCNTNNMNRHVRTRHPSIYKVEVGTKGEADPILELGGEVETPYAVKTEEICASGKDYGDGSIVESLDKRAMRRSWVWSYFKKLSGTQAQCKLCDRNISHGGNATGNMNRHIKMIHKEVYSIADPDITKVADENSWVWKVFESDEDDFYSCKICQFKCTKYASIDKSVLCILKHLKVDHGVVSGDQIITSVDCDTETH